MPKGPLDPNRLLGQVQDPSTNPEMNTIFDTQPVEPSGVTSTYSKSLQKSESGEEDLLHPDALYLDNVFVEDLSSW